MAFMSVVMISVIFEAMRRSKLRERYAILWMATGFVTLICAIYPPIIDFVKRVLGVQEFFIAAGVLIFFFFILVIFHMSIELSQLKNNSQQVARHSTLLAARIEELEKELKALKDKS